MGIVDTVHIMGSTFQYGLCLEKYHGKERITHLYSSDIASCHNIDSAYLSLWLIPLLILEELFWASIMD